MGRKRNADPSLRAKGVAGTVRIAGVEFVLLAKSEYLRLAGKIATSGESPPAPGMPSRSTSTSQRLFAARRAAGLTQAALAERLGKSQTLVSLAEAGAASVGERYVQDVLSACELPEGWGAPKQPKRVRKAPEQLEPHEIAGFDPETMRAVERGSKRDKELSRKYVWWSNAAAGRAMGFGG
jgi:transcriptional regulator with XRE-family HTH domain